MRKKLSIMGGPESSFGCSVTNGLGFQLRATAVFQTSREVWIPELPASSGILSHYYSLLLINVNISTGSKLRNLIKTILKKKSNPFST